MESGSISLVIFGSVTYIALGSFHLFRKITEANKIRNPARITD